MQPPIFENAYFLQAVGWSIANSFWQTGLLWLLYKFIISADKKLPSQVKHHLGIAFLIASLCWFIFTIFENYSLLANSLSPQQLMFNKAWQVQQINKYLPLLSFVYFLLLFFYLVKFIKKLAGNNLLQNSGLGKAPVNFRLFTTNTAIHLGIKSKVQVWMSAHVDVPSVTGFLKPIILLPAAIINHLTVNQAEAILLHELAHIKRNDYLVNLVQAGIELLLFFNPFVALLGKATRKERENCCDDWVLNYRYNQFDYASALLVLEEQRTCKLSFAMAATDNKKNLLLRIKRLFNTSVQTDFNYWHKAKLFASCILAVVLIIAALPLMQKNNAEKIVAITKAKGQFVKNNNQSLMNENVVYNEKPLTKILTGKPMPVLKKLNLVGNKKDIKELPTDYVNAYINEELLSPNTTLELATFVTDKEIKEQKYYIKIEEQLSGSKQTNTYYFELNNKDGNQDIKPLIILNKFKKAAPVKLQSIKKSTDSSLLPRKKRITT